MWGRDDSKDHGNWGDKNFWCLNLNALMLSKVGFDARPRDPNHPTIPSESELLIQPGYLSRVSPSLCREWGIAMLL